jgi:small nuclear ribonucleoprotein (snRNP)-like protein
MRAMKIGIMIPITIVFMMVFGVILAARGTLDSVDGFTNTITNTTTNTTTTAGEEASQSIRGAITETGEFLGNVTEKVATSKSAGTIVNETSEVLGNATVETQKFFSPDNN